MSQMRLAGNGGSKIAHNTRIVLRMLPSETGSDWWLQFQGLSKPLRYTNGGTPGGCNPRNSTRMTSEKSRFHSLTPDRLVRGVTNITIVPLLWSQTENRGVR